jgi:apolipoprotein D and lipocalin family protein
MKLIILTLFFFSITLFSQQPDPKTVDYVDLTKYTGLWYEIARIPNRFQKHCVKGTTAEYSLKENGEILVINSCTDNDNEVDVAEGVAKVVDKKSNARLEVSFVSFFGWRPFWGDYWIIGLDENYQWAVIGHPERKYGWILSRTKNPDRQMLDEAFDILIKQGYNLKDFIMSVQ